MHGVAHFLATAQTQGAGRSLLSLGTDAALTLAVSILTLFVAGVTLKISYRAFQSQKKTEKLQKSAASILSNIRYTEGAFREDVGRFIQAVEEREAFQQQMRLEEALTRIRRAVDHSVSMARVLVDWLPTISMSSPAAVQAIVDRLQEFTPVEDQYKLDLVSLQEVGAWHVYAECDRKVTTALLEIGLAISTQKATHAQAALRSLNEVQADWIAWSMMDRPNTLAASQWVRERVGHLPQPVTTKLASLYHSPKLAVFEKMIRSIQISDGRWFAWANANMTWHEWQAESTVNGIFADSDEALKPFLPIPLFWALESSSESASESVLQAVVIHLAANFNSF